MKRVAWLVICLAGALVGCDKVNEKELTVRDINVAAPVTPNLAIDSAGGVNVPALDLSVTKSQADMHKEYDAYVSALRDSRGGGGAKKGTSGAAGTPAVTDPNIPAPPGADAAVTDAGLVGTWKATKIDPKPDNQQMADEMMKAGFAFKADHTFAALEAGVPVPDADASGTWTLKDGTVTLSVGKAPPLGFTGKNVTMPGPAGTTIYFEKQ